MKFSTETERNLTTGKNSLPTVALGLELKVVAHPLDSLTVVTKFNYCFSSTITSPAHPSPSYFRILTTPGVSCNLAGRHYVFLS